MKAKNRICTIANYLYAEILKFEKNKLSSKQKKLIDRLKSVIEDSVGHAKYSTQMLYDFKCENEPDFDGSIWLDVFFDESKDYTKEIIKESKKIKDELDLEDVDFKKPDDKWSKYSLVNHYAIAYELSILINDSLTPNISKKFKGIMKKIERGYYMAYRICNKLQEYEERKPNEKFKDLKYYSKRFKEINLKRNRKK